MQAHSENLADLAAALTKAQGEFPAINLDAKGQIGQNRDYKYASLANIIDKVRPVLAKHGLAVVQTCEPAESGFLRVTTTLLHASGQYLEGTITMPAGSTPQQYGSAMTYARRYQLAAILSLAAEDDDDGAAASQKTPPRARTQQQPSAPSPQATIAYGALTAASASDIARRWFAAKLKEDYGLTHDGAKELLGVESFKEEMPDHTLEQILGFVKMAQLRQQQARANDV